MDLNQKILAAILAAFFLIALIRVFQTPLRLALKLLANTLLGFLALWVVNLTAGVTGITLGLNLLNVLSRCQPLSPPRNRQMVSDGGVEIETVSAGPPSSRNRISARCSDSFQTA